MKNVLFLLEIEKNNLKNLYETVVKRSDSFTKEFIKDTLDRYSEFDNAIKLLKKHKDGQ